ncbi:MAG: hypothetical protein LRZ93_04945 [Clostridiales bacterium]|nr:hypothetical protein [Clostridiales bacterium]
MIKKKRKNHQNLIVLLLALLLIAGSVITFSQQKLGNTVVSVNRVVKNIYSFLAKSIFSIDISEPITFIQTQFTASAIYSNSEVYVTSIKKENNLTVNDVKEQPTNLNSVNVVQANTDQ